MRGAARRAQLEPQRCRASPRPSRLSVGSPLIRNRAARSPARSPTSRAVAAALFADDEQQADARLAVAPQPLGRRDLRREDALGVARRRGRRGGRPRPGSGKTAARSRSASTRRRPAASPTRREDVEARVVDRLLGDGEARARAGSRPASGRPRLRGRSSNRCRPARASGRRDRRPVLPDPRFELRARVGPRVAVLDDDRRGERQPPLRALADRDRARARARRPRLRE